MKLQTKKRRSSILFTQGRRKKKKPETGKTIPKDSDSQPKKKSPKDRLNSLHNSLK